MTSHLFIPDTQIRKGVPLDHLDWAGKFILDERPDAIILAGDWADFCAISKHHSVKSREGQRLLDDLTWANSGLHCLMSHFLPVIGKSYNPKLVFTLGNHEHRLTRYIEEHPELDGLLTFDLLDHRDMGWDCVPFLQPITVDNIAYSHFFPQTAGGRVLQNKRGQSNARLQGQRVEGSSTAGHQQGFDYSQKETANGLRHAIIAGSFYLHDEGYKTPQGNGHWRGLVYKTNVRNGGDYDLNLVSMDELERSYA